jgi:hypothetical protein
MPGQRALIIACIAFLIVGGGAIFASYKLAGGIGAAFMSFGVILASLLSIMGVGFNVWYSKKHARPHSPPRR